MIDRKPTYTHVLRRDAGTMTDGVIFDNLIIKVMLPQPQFDHAWPFDTLQDTCPV